MKKLLFLIILLFYGFILFSQNNYYSGNQAYINEQLLGFNPVTINNGNIIYTYDSVNKIYFNNNKVLIPDLTTVENGKNIDINNFFGFGTGGSINDTLFNWDKKSIALPNEFDVINMFVSPLSATGLSYAKAIQNNNSYCVYNDCLAIIDGPEESLAYPDYFPKNGAYNLWTGEELIDIGDLKTTGLSQKVSQQQTDTTINMSYCVNKYGIGWRLPTDIEVGHFNDDEGVNCGIDSVYMGFASQYIWTSSLYKTFVVKRWTTRITDGYWENCGGFLYVTNNVRCVFPGYKNFPSANLDKNNEFDKKLFIYPNPSNGIFNFSIKLNKNFIIDIFDILGNKVLTIEYENTSYSVDITSLPNGIYFCFIKTNENSFKTRLIKIN